jgi:tRNA threonylcarbamoyladenosine biosynthesis protein TsaE
MVWPSGISTSTASTIRANGEEAGFRDLFASAGLKLAEWPERAADVLPVADLEVHIQTQADESRLVTCRPRTATGEALLKDAIP